MKLEFDLVLTDSSFSDAVLFMSFHQKSSYENTLVLNYPRFWNNSHVLFLKFQRDRYDSAMNFS